MRVEGSPQEPTASCYGRGMATNNISPWNSLGGNVHNAGGRKYPARIPTCSVRCVTHVSGPDPRKVARPVRFELTTPCSGGMYSIHLSYGRAVGAPSRRSVQRAKNRCDLTILSRLISSRQPRIFPARLLRRRKRPITQSRGSEFPSRAFRFLRPSSA